MARNTRKRPADSGWESPLVSKATKSSDAEVTPSIQQRSRRAGLANDFNSWLCDTRVHPATQYRSGGHKFILPASVPQSYPTRGIGKTPEHPAHPQRDSSTRKTLSRSDPLRRPINTTQSTTCAPRIFHQPHPASKLYQDFHYVPYPLGLLPYDSWHKLHNREGVHPSLPFTCPVCQKEREVTAHTRKLFLVAERLTWKEGLMPNHEKDLKEELNWEINYKLGILDPFVEDADQVAVRKNSRMNKFHPYQNKNEMRLAFELMFMTENLTEVSWSLWIGTQLDLEKMFGAYVVNYRSLLDFYALLDQIERTSYVGALFLEAYAEERRHVQGMLAQAQR